MQITIRANSARRRATADLGNLFGKPAAVMP